MLTEVVDKGEEAGTKEEGKEHGAHGVAVLEQARGQSSTVTLPELNTNEDGNHETKADKEADDARVAPGIISTTPLQSKQKADDGRDEDGGTDEIEHADTLEKGHLAGLCRVTVNMDEEEDDDHGEATDGEVDVEAPTPGCVLGEDTAKEGTSDGSDTPHATDETKSERTFLEGHY